MTVGKADRQSPQVLSTRVATAQPRFNRTLWSKTARESSVLLLSLAVLLFAFGWVYVWLISKIELNVLFQFLIGGLKDLERLSGVPFQEVATPEGRVALAFVDPLVHLGVIVWAISRGSDTVAGELERGTLEMLLAQPVSRLSIYASKSVVAGVGLVVICAAFWCGLSIGIRLLVDEIDHVWPAMYVPPTINVFGLGFAMAGIATLVSSCDRYRWRTIGIMGGFYAVAIILKVIARMAPGWEAIGYASIFWPFEPQRLVTGQNDAWRLLWEYNVPLIAIGVVGYVAGGVIFCRRDLPAPL
jgi:ABC-2 type transport system permease protein